MNRDELKEFNLPDEPGVYLFKKGRKILYIGKAASLRDRVRSYFSSDLGEARSPAIVGMVEEANNLSFQKTDSVLEALILEANLIKKHQPPFNVDQKDNKSWNYVVITKEDFPRVLLVRGRELFQGWDRADIKYLFGPYPHGGQLKDALAMIRRIFPFRDKCMPQSGKPCFNRQIGLCPGVCSGEISKTEYAKTIKNLKELLSGNFKGLKRDLNKQMADAAKKEEFEKASELRRQISSLEHIRDVSLMKRERRVAAGGRLSSRREGARIEAYDVAHTAGSETVAVMTVVENGEAQKQEYRKFKIRSAKNDDVASLKEALSRRLNHPEWPLPKVFVVDGSKGQVRAAEKILEEVGVGIPVVGVVKNEFHKPKGMIGDKDSIDAYGNDILLANNEAHRYGIGWHRNRLRKRML